jgi:hypothetical protein
MSGGKRSTDRRWLAVGFIYAGILWAGLAAGSHWHRASRTAGASSPPATTFASNASSARPSSVLVSGPLASFPLTQRPVAIPHPAKRTPVPKSSALELRSSPSSSPTISPIARARAMKTYAALPMMFEANSGQTDPRVKFLAHAPGYVLYLTGQEAVLSLQQPPSVQTGGRAGTAPVLHSRAPQPQKAARAVRLGFVGGNPAAVVAGRELLAAKSNYFIGNDPKQWHTNVPNYAAVEYRQIYPGVDAVFHGDNRRLEFDFDIAPGADPHAIALEVDGARQIRLDRAGDLLLRMQATGNLIMAKPRVYQRSPEGRHEIAGHYVLGARNRIAFALDPYDRTQPLVIDPTVEYATYLGGSGSDYAEGIAVDSSGNAYVTGNTSSTNFPTVDPYESAGTAFVSKLNPTGSALVYSTYLSGAGAYAIAVDSAGSVYVTGSAQSGLPTMNPYQATSHGTVYNAFVTKLDASGSALIYSTYLGGDYADEGFGIAVDSSGSAYVTGLTNSAGFPTVNPIQATCNDCAVSANLFDGDAFVTKFSPDGSSLVYSTYLGGSAQDWGQSITVDSSGSAYVTGLTQSTNFPTANAFQPANASTMLATTGESAFVSKLNPSGSALVYSTYLGGSAEDYGSGIAVDSAGSAYVTGFAQSHNFPTMNPYQATMRGANNAFVTKFNADGSALVYSTYLGGASATQGNSIAVDPFGNAYVTGSTTSSNFPLVDATQTSCLGCSSYSSAFVAQFNATGSSLLFSTYLGGSKATVGYGIAVDPSGDAHVAGLTESTNFPTVAPFQATNKSASETAFVAMYSFPPETALTLSPTTIPSGTIDVAYSPVTITATGATGTVTFAVTSGSLPSGVTLTTAGVLSGTPTQIGTYPFTVTAADTSGDSGSQPYSLQIACQTITVGPSTLAPGIAGTPYGPVTFTETGGVPPITFSETGLPTGIGMSFAAGVLSGTPTTAESFPITVTATDSNQCFGNITDTLTINSSTITPAYVTDNETITVTDTETFPDVGDSEAITVKDTVAVRAYNPISISPSSVFSGVLNQPYTSSAFVGSGGFGGLTLSESGAVPTGMAFTGPGSSITLSGTPTTLGTGSWPFTITATDSAGDAATQNYTLTIAGACPSIGVTPTSLANLTIGTVFSQLFAQSGGVGLITWSEVGPLPAGLTFVGGLLSGTPTQAGNFSFTIVATDANSCTGNVSFSSLSVAPAPAHVTDTETITVTDTETFPDVADSETITVSDQVTVTASPLFPASLTFADQLVGSTSATQTVTLTNGGTAKLTVGTITITPDFTHPSKTCTATLAAGSSCTISVAFAPKSAGPVTGTLTVGTNGTVALSGTGFAPSASLTPATYEFVNQQVDTTSKAQTFTYSNTGLVSITVSAVTLSGAAAANYVIVSNPCTGVTLAPNATCDVAVTFTPSAANNRVATLAVADETGGAAKATASLSGTGVAATASLTGNGAFGNQQVGVTSAEQMLTYQNTGLGSISVNSAALSGKAAADYVVATDNCTGAVLAASANCSIGLTLTPSAVGNRAASLTVTDSTGGAAAQSLGLSGTGVAPTISLGSGTYAYGGVTVATPATFTLANSGTAPFVIGTIALTTGPQFNISGGTCIVGNTVSNGSSCTVIVTFTPSDKTTFTDTLTVQGTGVGTGAPIYSASRAMTGH